MPGVVAASQEFEDSVQRLTTIVASTGSSTQEFIDQIRSAQRALHAEFFGSDEPDESFHPADGMTLKELLGD
jgi:hypothetical protein